MHTTKIHRLVMHLGDKLRTRGKLWERDLSENKRLHSTCKQMFKRGNKSGPNVSLQMMRCNKTQSAVLQELDLPRGGGSDGGTSGDDGSATTSPSNTSDLSFTGRGRRMTIGLLRESPGPANLGDLFDLEDSDWVTVRMTARIMARIESAALTRMQLLRVTADLMGKPWMSFVRNKSWDGSMRWGRLGLVLRSLGTKRRSGIVVQRLQRAEPRPGCVLSKYGCTQLAWEVPPNKSTYPALGLIDASCIYREDNIHEGWFDFAERLGLFSMPSNKEDTEARRGAIRFFTNPSFPLE